MPWASKCSALGHSLMTVEQPRLVLVPSGDEEDNVRFTRGFHNPHPEPRDPRLPPGQYDTGTLWPVLTAEVTPALSVASWTFSVEGLVEHPTSWTWDQIHALPQSSF